MDPVIGLVAAYRVAGSLVVLRWPFWGGVVAVACDLGDLLLFDIARTYGGWPGFDGYQAFDKWLDQVYLGAFLIVAIQDFPTVARRIAVALWLFRFVGFLAFEAGVLSRDALILVPNVFEFWFLALAFTLRYRPSFRWTIGRSAAILIVLLAGKLVQEWALHVGRLFDELTFLGGLRSIIEFISGPITGR